MFIQFTEDIMAKICISGYYGFKNFGDEAILSVLVEHFRGNDITVFSSDPEFTSKTYNVGSTKNFDIKYVIKSIKDCDVLISGGGSLLQDVTSLKSLVYYSLIISLAVLFNKKVIIFAQGIGPINNKIAKILVPNLLKFCSLVTVRDEKSLKYLEQYGVSANLVCDPIYSLQVKQNREIGTIGIQLRDFKTMNYNLLHKLAMFVATKFYDKKVKIFSLQNSQDYAICEKFQNVLKSINPEISSEIVSENIVENISKLEYLIAMRFHAVLVALKSGVKTCAINYDIKVENLSKDADIPIISMDAHENFEKVYEKMINLDCENLSKFANSKQFDWTNFDKCLIISK
jgi:polysaccharide pyruvyl transferase CsaB